MLEKEVLLELHYLPNIQFFSKLANGKVYLEHCENYSKGSYRNRCHIASSHGLLSLSIPLRGGKNQQQSIREVLIADETPWQSQHWTSIKSAYGKSPFFEYYADTLKPFYKKKYKYLWDWNFDLLHTLNQLLQIETNIELTEVYQKTLPDGIQDLRNSISPKTHKTKEDNNFNPIRYAQVFEDQNGYLPNLSILDLLFCTGPEASFILEKSSK